MNHIFKKSNKDVVYITTKQICLWVSNILERSLGYPYVITANPLPEKNDLGLTIGKTSLTEEELQTIQVLNDLLMISQDLFLQKVLELSSKRSKRKKAFNYKVLMEDSNGFYLIREKNKNIRKKEFK